MSDKDEIKYKWPMESQEEWEKMIARLSDEELTEWGRRQYDTGAIKENTRPDDDEEWEAMMAAMTDDERIAYVRGLYEVISSNPELSSIIPLELREEMKAGLEKYEKQNEECKVLEQRSRIANALRDSTANALLTEMGDITPPSKKGH